MPPAKKPCLEVVIEAKEMKDRTLTGPQIGMDSTFELLPKIGQRYSIFKIV